MSDYMGKLRVVDDTKERCCLRCEQTFVSAWAGDRICKNCKQTSTWRSGTSFKAAS